MRRPSSPSVSPNGGIRYKQPETPFEVHSYSLKDIVRRVGAHRRSVPFLHLDLIDGWQERLLSDLCDQNSHMKCEDANPSETHPLVVEGRKLWGEMHAFAASLSEALSPQDVERAKAWLSAWRDRIPRYGCKCRDKFRVLEAARPANFSSGSAFAKWCIDIHNDVNVSLNKPVFTPDMPLDKFG